MTAASAPAAPKRPIGLFIAIAVIALLPFLGKGGIMAAAILALALVGAPLFVILGSATVLCFVLWTTVEGLSTFSTLIERTRTLADSPNILAIPLFIMSGAVMARGKISQRLVEFARAFVGFIPGGMAISAVAACMLFAAISGSSPATVIAIGAMMGPILVKHGYGERFSHGLLASAGSLGILIPPSIPMVVYPLVFPEGQVELEELFASGFGPGFLIGGLLMAYSMYVGVRDKTPTERFDPKRILTTIRDGIWALFFPVFILGGIYAGVFYALEAAAASVVYAVVVEVFVHRAIRIRDLPAVFHETSVFLGSLLVIMIAALVFQEFLEGQGVPAQLVQFVRGLDLEPWQFLLAMNLLLLVVGALMDILSAMFIFVPLLAPLAASEPFNVDPLHFGIIFIVNLEIGYLTPPVGLNLFVASTLFERPIDHMIRAVLPFIAVMIVGLGVVTYVPSVSVGLGRWIMGSEAPTEHRDYHVGGGEIDEGAEDDEGAEGAGERTVDEIAGELARVRAIPNQTMGDMQREGALADELDERADALRTELERIRAIESQSMGDMQREGALASELERIEQLLAPPAPP